MFFDLETQVDDAAGLADEVAVDEDQFAHDFVIGVLYGTQLLAEFVELFDNARFLWVRNFPGVEKTLLGPVFLGQHEKL